MREDAVWIASPPVSGSNGSCGVRLERMLMPPVYALLLLAVTPPGALAQRAPAPWNAAGPAVMRTSPANVLRYATVARLSDARGGMPTWVKWGLVGAGVGALTFPVLGGLASDSPQRPVARDAAVGAVAGFVIVGGSVALWQAVCGENSASRRAGLCGR